MKAGGVDTNTVAKEGEQEKKRNEEEEIERKHQQEEEEKEKKRKEKEEEDEKLAKEAEELRRKQEQENERRQLILNQISNSYFTKFVDQTQSTNPSFQVNNTLSDRASSSSASSSSSSSSFSNSRVTEVSVWLQDNKYDNLCNYFKTHGATRLREFRDFFASYDINELCVEFPELTKLLLFTIKSLLTSLSDDDTRSYTSKAVSLSSSSSNSSSSGSSSGSSSSDSSQLQGSVSSFKVGNSNSNSNRPLQ